VFSSAQPFNHGEMLGLVELLAAAAVFSPAGSARATPVIPTILTRIAKTATNRMNFVDILISPFAELQVPQSTFGCILTHLGQLNFII
jgi:hypothetical protein